MRIPSTAKLLLAPLLVGWGVVAAVGSGCSAAGDASTGIDTGTGTGTGPTDAPPNILLVLLDDVGIDNVPAYGVGTSAPDLPTFDRLAESGQRFHRAWAMPSCSPTRAAILTGRYPSRTGVGSVVDVAGPYVMPTTDTLASHLQGAGYTTALAGKWHLATFRADHYDHPAWMGFDWAEGSWQNISNYDAFPKVVNGRMTTESTYATIDTTDDAIDFTTVLPEPWFVMVSYNAPHSPWSQPPPELDDGPPPADDAEAYDRMLAATDRELGRLLDTLPPERLERTIIVVLGDNGTPGSVLDEGIAPLQAKVSVLEGGVRVPLVMAGPLVRHPGSVVQQPAHIVDLLPTLADAAGVPFEGPTDGRSLLPALADPDASDDRILFAQRFRPNGDGPYERSLQVVSRGDHRLTWGPDGASFLRRTGPLEEQLLDVEGLGADEQQVFDALDVELNRLQDELGFRLDPEFF